MLIDASVTNVCVSHSFPLVYSFLSCVHSPVASWHQVGGKRQDAVQSPDSHSINHICTGTAGLWFLFKYWCGYTAGVPKCSTGGHRRAWFVRKCFLKGTTELLWCNVSSPGSVSTQILPALPVDDLRRQPRRTYQIPEGAFPSIL